MHSLLGNQSSQCCKESDSNSTQNPPTPYDSATLQLSDYPCLGSLWNFLKVIILYHIDLLHRSTCEYLHNFTIPKAMAFCIAENNC